MDIYGRDGRTGRWRGSRGGGTGPAGSGSRAGMDARCPVRCGAYVGGALLGRGRRTQDRRAWIGRRRAGQRRGAGRAARVHLPFSAAAVGCRQRPAGHSAPSTRRAVPLCGGQCSRLSTPAAVPRLGSAPISVSGAALHARGGAGARRQSHGRPRRGRMRGDVRRAACEQRRGRPCAPARAHSGPVRGGGPITPPAADTGSGWRILGCCPWLAAGGRQPRGACCSPRGASVCAAGWRRAAAASMLCCRCAGDPRRQSPTTDHGSRRAAPSQPASERAGPFARGPGFRCSAFKTNTRSAQARRCLPSPACGLRGHAS